MRTTIDIPDDLYKKLKSKAALEGTSVRSLMAQAAKSLIEPDKLPPIRKFRVPVIHSSRPGTLNLTNEEIDDILFLPDINVWLALAYERHQHHNTANTWYGQLEADSRLCFCRHSQIGFLRLVNNPSVMGKDARTQLECWHIFYEWIASGRAIFLNEPIAIDDRFAELTAEKSLSPNRWADMYLAAFAETAGVTLVTFDKALAGKTQDSILLK